MIDVQRLDEVVRSHAETLCRNFFPEGRKVGKEWRIASSPRVGRKKHKPGSLAIQLAGPYAGSWRDWATDERGAFVRLVMTKDNLRTIFSLRTRRGSWLAICRNWKWMFSCRVLMSEGLKGSMM
jgi:hypothetical protein